jgi:O-acetyl-ADP-ribose deacetylase (regulator of RNase III)
MEIEILEGSLLDAEAELIVNPANSYGYMGGGVAGVIKRFGGDIIEKEALKKAPIPVGEAILTTAGKLRFKGVVHSPTMEEPSMMTTPDKVYKATRAALELVVREGFKSVAMPGMGTGVGKVPKGVAARKMLEAIREFKNSGIERVLLIDLDTDMVKAWKDELEKLMGR